jgi:enoyl-CoA hydratase
MSGDGRRVAVERVSEEVALVRLNRPEVRNAMDAATIDELGARLGELTADRRCRAVILTGEGAAFCAGFDLSGYGDVGGWREDEEDDRPGWSAAMQEHISSFVGLVRGLRQPVIAAVNGAAVGGGLGLALACDVRVAAESARFSVGFLRIGLSGCDVSVSWTLPRLVGAGMAHELMLTGRMLDAGEAKALGLVTHVVADADLLGRAFALAEEIAQHAPLGVAMTKRTMWAALETPSQAAAMQLENRTQVLLLQTQDAREGRRAMAEKRPPRFSGA